MNHQMAFSIIRCQTSIFNMFNRQCCTWKINAVQENLIQCSNYFEFCGYCCHFISKCDDWGHLHSINLRGYPTLFTEKIFCNYSVTLKNDYTGVCHYESGQIDTAEETIDIVIYKGSLRGDIYNLLFSWSENGDWEGICNSLQKLQDITGYYFERIINVIGQATQTEETTSKEHCQGISPPRNVLTYAERIKNVSGQATQTEGTQISPTRDVCNWLPFVSAEVSTNVLEQSTQTEGTELLTSSDVVRKFADTIKRETCTNAVDSSTTVDSTCTYEENESFKFLEILSKDLGNFYESQTDPDCVLKVGETKFHVHRSVLAARSTVFGAMFHHDTSESQSGDVDIPDVDAGAFGDILYYVYTGKIRGLCPDTAASMYVVSDKYSLIDFREKCLSFLKNNLTMKNVCDAALLANAHSETELDNKIVQFIEENLEEITENDNWEKFSETHYKLANKLLCSACKISKNKLMKKPS